MPIAKEALQRLPKAELHLHLEGAVTPGILLRLAGKYDSELKGLDEAELRGKLFEYSDFQEFLATYKTVCEHLREAEDYLLILDHLAGYFREQNILYAEIFFSPSIPERFGRDGESVLEALLDKSDEIQSQGGVGLRWILDCVRQWGAEPARRTAELAVKHRERGVAALGLGGDERSLPMKEFAEVFRWAKAHEMFIHVHAGETGGPEQVWEALKVLGANRIGHGIQAAREAALMDYLREHAVGLDICLTSNQKTKAWTPMSSNPFGLLFKRGVPVSLSTDDPGLFETTLLEEYEKAVDRFEISDQGLRRLILDGARSAFLPHGERMSLMQRFTDRIHQAQGE